jgi:hypothetical protein
MDTIPGRAGTALPRSLAGRYRLDALIGSGGMGRVYRARDLTLGRPVAVKVLPADLAKDADAVRRFGREARAVASLSHPGIVTVFDAGVADEVPYIVMEYVEGRTLVEVLRREGPLDPPRAAGIAADVADALDAAHACGVVHRDVKPGNIMLTAGGDVRVMDFGIALSLDADATVTRSAMGTPTYAAPEQADGGPVDGRTDVYALGVVLYELLTGRPPFEAKSPLAVLAMHRDTVPDSPSSRVAAVPAAVDAVVATALAKRPGERFQSAGAMADALRRAAAEPSDGGTAAAPASSAVAVPTGPPTAKLADDSTAVLPAAGVPPAAPDIAPRRRVVRAAVLAAALAVLVLIAVVAAWPDSSTPTTPSRTLPAGPVVSPSVAPAVSPPTHGPKPPKCKDEEDAKDCRGKGHGDGPGHGPGGD